MLYRLILFCVSALVLLPAALPGVAQAQPAGECPLVPRLVVGEGARRLPDDLNNVRETPGLGQTLVGRLPGGGLVQVVGGPLCRDGLHWWEIEYGYGAGLLRGWTAEGDTVEGYWLEPAGALDIELSADGIPRAYYALEAGSSTDAEPVRERADCLAPPEDYTRTFIGYAEMNARTLFMLEHAHNLYRSRGGLFSLRDGITQGGYTGGALAASFGTHDGGGALDISVRSPLDFSILWDEIPLMLDSLRVAGFAAWLRRPDELYAGSVIHIHAIAVGDAELAPAARAQIDGDYGYLRGYNGLPPDWGGPALDADGEMIICQWMRDLGFDDLREQNP